LKNIADQMFYIRDGNISHTFTKEELQGSRQNAQMGGDVETYMPTNPNETNEAILTELRNIDHFVKDKISNIEKKMHPV